MNVTLEMIREKEKALSELKQELAKLRKQVPLERVEDYGLLSSFGTPVKLSELFGAKNELILVHNMGVGCSYCTLWADGFNGFVPHLEHQAAFVVESVNKPEIQRQFAADRGWKFQMVSSLGTRLRLDLGFADEDGSPWPGVSTLIKKPDGIYRVSSAFFGPGDSFCSFWDLLDLLPREQDYENCGVDFHYIKPKMEH